jgi:hypothetical protein
MWPALGAIDGVGATRFSTGVAQAGGEWFQVDFGQAVALTGVQLDCCQIVEGYEEALEDYARGYAVRLSDLPIDLEAPVLAEGVGAPGNIVAKFDAPKLGRFLLVTQTGAAVESYWSIHELNVMCE